MTLFRDFFVALDPYVIWAFRLVDGPWAGFLLGSLLLNLACVVLGDITSILARRLNRKVYGAYHDEMVRHHNLSVKALQNANKDAYKAVNKQANDAFGKYFFSQAGAFTLSIWPLPFALAWMEMRFGGIPLDLPFAIPGVGQSVFYQFFFIPIYIAVRISYGKLMRRVTAYQRVLHWTRHGDGTEMLSFVDLLKPSPEQDDAPAPKGDGQDAKPGERS
jgi:hypothetical protein